MPAAELARRGLAGDEAFDLRHDGDDLQPGLAHANREGGAEADRHAHHRRIRAGADQAEVLAARVLRRGCDRDLHDAVVAQHGEGQWPSRTRTDAAHQIGPRYNGVVVDLHDLIPAAQTRTLRRLAEDHLADASGEQWHKRSGELLAGGGIAWHMNHDGFRAAGDLEPQRFATREDLLLQIVPGLEGIAVETDDPITAPQGSKRLGPARHARDRDEPGVDHEREKQIHRDAGEDHRHPGPERLSIECTRGVYRNVRLPTFQLAHHAFVFEPRHLDVAAQRDPGDPVFRLAAPPLDDRPPESEREAQHLNADRLGDDEVAELVHRNEHAQDDDERHNRQEHATSSARRRASASAANTSSSEDPRPPSPVPRLTTCSMISAMRPNVIFSSRNSCTATSLAALNRAGAVPPSRAASRPTT